MRPSVEARGGGDTLRANLAIDPKHAISANGYILEGSSEGVRSSYKTGSMGWPRDALTSQTRALDVTPKGYPRVFKPGIHLSSSTQGYHEPWFTLPRASSGRTAAHHPPTKNFFSVVDQRDSFRLLAINIFLLLSHEAPICSSTRGLGTHHKKCGKRKERLRLSSVSAAATHAAQVASAAAAESEEALATRQNPIEEVPADIECPPSPLPPGPGGRPRRRPRLPARYRDDLPEGPAPIPPPVAVSVPEPEPAPDFHPVSPPKWIQTEPNAYGVYKVFPNCPTHDPEASISLDDLCRSPDLLTPTAPPTVSTDPAATPPFFPFLNSTVARLMTWFHLGSNLKSNAELDSLVNNVILHQDFDPKHLEGFSAARENKRLDDAVNTLPGQPPDGWKTASVKLKVPAPKICVPEAQAAEFEVSGIIYRPLLDVMVDPRFTPAMPERSGGSPCT
ncbi:hypothetical protein B0H13DRAFT_1877279 [Mycena leptocephala]|nr:hypothetical protein B0H13DRAFT_1877279 [Mycena leptocephala]